MAGLLFSVTIFISAFLLFAVQPLIARFVLPWFGGAAAVWTTCLLFFQTLLLGGYLYAHLLADHLKPRVQMIVHLILLLACLAALPIAPSLRLAPPDADYPTLRLLIVLTLTVGLPYFALSATSPLVQHWFAQVYPGRSVYRLFALSNVGSLVALVSYPFVIEPALTRRQQSSSWSTLLVVFAIACGASAVIAARRGTGTVASPADEPLDPHPPLTPRRSALILVLTMLASAFLLSVTNKICMEIAPFPFLWVLPLTLYLLAFIICFEWPDQYHRAIVMPLAALATLAAIYVMVYRNVVALSWQIAVLHLLLLLCCIFCLGETARLRPHSRHLTRYYLLVSLGGVIGAMLVALVAPRVFNLYLELHVCIAAVWILGCGVLLLSRSSPMRGFRLPLAWIAPVVLLPIALLALYFDATANAPDRILARRSFYGVLEVIESQSDNQLQWHRALYHNGVMHGSQFMHPNFRRNPVAYYEPFAGIGVLMTKFHPDRPKRVAVIGLGAGCIIAYARAGDEYVFYELDPDDIEVANTHFTYLKDTPAKTRVVAGDGRLSLSREPDDVKFDIIALDAFSGDAVPFHLLTIEAFELYRKHLAPGGVIIANLSNRNLNLLPPTWAMAKHFNYAAAMLGTNVTDTPYRSDWLLMSDDHAFIDSLKTERAYRSGRILEIAPWTDDYAALFPLLRGGKRPTRTPPPTASPSPAAVPSTQP